MIDDGICVKRVVHNHIKRKLGRWLQRKIQSQFDLHFSTYGQLIVVV